MAEDWNFYFAQVDGAVASVFVDLAHGAGAVDPTRPVVAWVSLKMRTPRADGLSSIFLFPCLARKWCLARKCENAGGCDGERRGGTWVVCLKLEVRVLG